MDPQHRAEWLAHWNHHATHLPTPCSPPSPTAPAKRNVTAYLKGSTDSYFRGSPSRTCVKTRTPASKKLTWASPIAHNSTRAVRAAGAVQRSSAVKEALAEYATKHLDTVSQAMGIHKFALLDGFKDYEDQKPVSQRQLFTTIQTKGSASARHGNLCTCVSCKERAYERQQASFGLQDTTTLIQDSNFRKAALSADLDWALQTAEQAREQSRNSTGKLCRQYSFEEISRHGSPHSPVCCAQSPTHNTFSAAAQKLAFTSPDYNRHVHNSAALHQQPRTYAFSAYKTPTKDARKVQVSKSCGPAWRIAASWGKQVQETDSESSSGSDTEQRDTNSKRAHIARAPWSSSKHTQHKSPARPAGSAAAQSPGKKRQTASAKRQLPSKRMFKPATGYISDTSSDSDSDNDVGVAADQAVTPARHGPAFMKQAKILFSTSKKKRAVASHANSSPSTQTSHNRSPAGHMRSPQSLYTLPKSQSKKTASAMKRLNLSYSSSDDDDIGAPAKTTQQQQRARSPGGQHAQHSRQQLAHSPGGHERHSRRGKPSTNKGHKVCGKDSLPAHLGISNDVWSEDDSIDVPSRNQSAASPIRTRHARLDKSLSSRLPTNTGLSDSSSEGDNPPPSSQRLHAHLASRPVSQAVTASPLIAKRAEKLLLQQAKGKQVRQSVESRQLASMKAIRAETSSDDEQQQ